MVNYDQLAKVIKKLIEKIPEIKDYPDFQESIEDYPELIYVVYASFAIFLKERIEKYDEDDPLIRRCFDFINEIIDMDNIFIENLIAIELFEVLVETKKEKEISEKLLSKKSLEVYNEVKKFYDPESHIDPYKIDKNTKRFKPKFSVFEIREIIAREFSEIKKIEGFKKVYKEKAILSDFFEFFGNYIVKKIEEPNINNNLVESFFSFINNIEIWNESIYVVFCAIFKAFLKSERAKYFSRKYLSKELLDIFEDVEEYY